jgi:2-succinyl-5-enolpyruvyl-6-hydroxy-3-cyclohexene-1-carboxylate synthase
MTSDKKNIAVLKALFKMRGLRDVVISPGSRNAPVVIAFAYDTKLKPYSIVDERSAAFFALGVAQHTGKTVAIASTSGSAPLNYSPAVAEAYYQKIPLLVLTADRPPHLIDVGDGQTVRQQNVFANFIKKSYNLPLELTTEKDFAETERIVNEALWATMYPEPGPVHVNIPFDEPLYGTTEYEPAVTVRNNFVTVENTGEEIDNTFVNIWNTTSKIMIIAGQQFPSEKLKNIAGKLAAMPQVAFLTETTSNFYGKNFIDTIDNVLVSLKNHPKEYAPRVLITFGNAVVSKKIKKFLRDNKPALHYHISPSGEKRDTYFSLSDVIVQSAGDFFEKIIDRLKPVKSDYGEKWMLQKENVKSAGEAFINQIPFSDLKVFDFVLKSLPANSNLHLGNSTPVRYSQLFGNIKGITCFSNRGVSGIDGQVSTAAGVSLYSEKTNVLITGDLGFFYDSNALMNKYLKPNFKIIIINNGGGGIFRFIPGPSDTPFVDDYFATSHSWSAEGIAKTFGIDYFRAVNEWEMKAQLPVLLKSGKRPGILEIITQGDKSANVLKNYFRFIENECSV